MDIIESKIYVIRGLTVMLDSDLAELYGVELKRLNEQVKRNLERFPEDFMFKCDFKDLESLRSQFATANGLTYWNHKRRTRPYVFTENGVAMLSSVLNSKRAIQVNISIMRIFTKLRSFLLLENKLNKLEKDTNHMFRVVFEKLEANKITTSKSKKKIGLKN